MEHVEHSGGVSEEHLSFPSRAPIRRDSCCNGDTHTRPMGHRASVPTTDSMSRAVDRVYYGSTSVGTTHLG